MKRNNKKGFTLVEVLIAVLLISISTAALVAAVTSAVKINRTAKEKDLAFRTNLEQVETYEAPSREGTLQYGDGNSVPVTVYTSDSEKGEDLSTFKKS